MYKTNQQCWDKVTKTYNEAMRREKICQDMFDQPNLIGLTQEQKDLFYKTIYK